MKKWLFNPFVYIAGARSLLIGWAFMLVTALICCYSKTHFDGVIDLHTGMSTSFHAYFFEAFIDWGCAVLVFYPAGAIFSASSIRFVDVAGTMALARWVMLFPAIIDFGIAPVPNPATHTMEEVIAAVTPLSLALGLVSAVFSIWMIVLMFRAFSVSCNMKGGKATGVFIAGLVVAEVISKIIFHAFYKAYIV